MDFFLIHCIALGWLSLLAGRSILQGTANRLLAAGLLAWGNVVVTCLLLASFHQLGDRGWFLATSTGIAAATWLCLRRLRTSPAEQPSEPSPAWWLWGVVVFTVVPAGIVSGIVAAHYPPSEDAALSFQLPRVMYYLGQEHLGHFTAADFRQVSLPFNYSLLQVLGLIYSQPVTGLNLFNLVAWMLGGITAYRLCRDDGFSATASTVASWFALMIPPVLAQAGSTTPEIAVGVALGCTLLFARRWRRTGGRGDAWLAALATGLAAGSDLRALALILLGIVAAVISLKRLPGTSVRAAIHAWLAPALLAGVIGLPFAAINLLAAGSSSAWWQSGPSLAVTLQGWVSSGDQAGWGMPGAWLLVIAVWNLARDRTARTGGWSLGWILIALVLPRWSAASPHELVPALLLLSPGLAMVVDHLRTRPTAFRLGGGAIIVAMALLTGWSASAYLLHNPSRPAAGLLGAQPPPALAAAPLLVEYHLTRQKKINVETDGADERIFPLMVLRPDQRFTSRRDLDPTAFNLISRSTQSRKLSYEKLTGRSGYVMVFMPHKSTAGVEFLATIGLDSAARDYFGLVPDANLTPALPGNSALLVTVSPEKNISGHGPRTRIQLAGLNPQDNASLHVSTKSVDGTLTPLASLTGDGETSAAPAGPFEWLIFRALDNTTGQELGAAALPFHAADQEVQPLDPNQPSGPGSLFVTDLVLARQTVITTEGLTPVEGPFPQWDLPHVRWAREPVVRIRIPAQASLARLQVSFSVRPHVRARAALDVFLNGKRMAHLQLEGRTTWLEPKLELVPQEGENVLELRDASGESVPDWMDYLTRYPDVKADLSARGIPFEEGARQHFENHGRGEGRTVVVSNRPEAVPDSFYFLFRHLKLEGFNTR